MLTNRLLSIIHQVEDVWGIEPENLLINTTQRRHLMFHDQFRFQWPTHQHDMDKVVQPPEQFYEVC